MRTTMKDIARDLGVSVVTVSKVLRNQADIGEVTRQKVLQRITEMDYHPNTAARSLVSGRSYLVGLVVPDLLHPFFAEVAQSFSRELRKDGYYLIISASDEDPELEQNEVEQLLGQRLDALVVASASSTAEAFARVEKLKIPYVLIDRSIAGLSANFVGTNDERVGVLATRHLIDVGCKRIAHIRGPENSPGNGRMEGYRRTLVRAGLPVPEAYTVSGGIDRDSRQRGINAMQQLLKLKPPPDGVFCFSDPLAMGVMECILDSGLRIPQDIAVIGCGNLHYNTSLRVPLSSIDQRCESIGEVAARLLLAALKSKVPLASETVILEPRLVVRESTNRKVKRVVVSRSSPAARTTRRNP